MNGAVASDLAVERMVWDRIPDATLLRLLRKHPQGLSRRGIFSRLPERLEARNGDLERALRALRHRGLVTVARRGNELRLRYRAVQP